jgi:hypothetical protein
MPLEMFMIHILRVQIIILRQPAAKDQLSRCFDLIHSAELGSVGNVQQERSAFDSLWKHLDHFRNTTVCFP